MVGFGSSLRMARRSGWEGAYFDYETHKLLLSQIEAVYEEEGHRQRQSEQTFMDDAEKTKQSARDYREELFLESDSDKAFASLDEGEESSLSTRSTDDLEAAAQAKPFTLSYSHEATSSDEDSQEMNATACSPFSLSPWTTSTDPQRKKERLQRKRRNMVSPPLAEDDDFYAQGSAKAPSTFFLAGSGAEDEATTGGRPPDASTSILSAGFRVQSETTSLLPPTTPAHQHGGASSLYSLSQENALTPPTKNLAPFVQKDMSGETSRKRSSPPPVLPSLKTKKWEEERKHERRLRRKKRRQLKAKRRERERKVPRHIRVAHSKARAITERFLGLLRAETEKVMLFAQARLGELADTAGSLRFPSYEETGGYGSGSNSQHEDLRAAASFEYPLSDGGLHPSASSSDEEGTVEWSDNSDDENESKPLANSFSVGAMSADDTVGRSNRSARKLTPKASVRKRVKKPEIKDQETLKAIQRQIAHFAELRNTRPVFQRNDHILGEDMLLISAVEEADGYTAIAVELMHVLRFICVNLIAVRKICRKHDRLLMQRQLGGYYHRARARGAGEGSYSHIEDSHTLGGLLARVSGDIYEAHPALIGQMNHYKLVGVYDKKIQQLANSRTVQVVSSCLALALAEAEVTHSRADALTKLNSSTPPKRSGAGRSSTALDDYSPESEEDEGPPSTASSVSLTRLRFTVTSIFALREAARYKLNSYGTYLSRCALVFTGQSVIGEGLDGCSRETLDFLVAYNPDAALLLDSDVLFNGLKNGHWLRAPVGDVMISTLAAASLTSPENAQPGFAPPDLSQEELIVSNVVSIAPQPKWFIWQLLLKGRHAETQTVRSLPLAHPEFPLVTLGLNRMTYFLYMMNYFVSHATTVAFVKATGGESVHSALIIGAPCLSALFIATFHCFLLSKDFAALRFRVMLFRRLFLFSAFIAVVANIVHASGVNEGSVRLAIFGRFLLGFSSAEILHRQLMSTCWSYHVVSEAAKLFRSRAGGVVCGLFVGSLTDVIPIRFERFGVRTLQAASWFMSFLWMVQFFRVFLRFRPNVHRGVENGLLGSSLKDKTAVPEHSSSSESDSSDDESPDTPNSVLYRSSSDVTGGSTSQSNSLKATYGTSEETSLLPTQAEEITLPRSPLLSPVARGPTKRRFRHLKTFTSRIRKLLSYHVGIPVTLALLFYVNFGLEVFFTATPIVTDRYFGWSGTRAGLFLASLAITILPLEFVCELVARRYEERTVIKRSLVVIGFGLFVMINWVSLFRLAREMPSLLNDIDHRLVHPYDWRLGTFQYVVGLSITFVGMVSLEGATLSLLSKVSPSRLQSVVINVGTIVTFLSLLSRFMGDIQILLVGSSHKLINTDIVNSLVVPLLLVSFAAYYLVKKHYFFLM